MHSLKVNPNQVALEHPSKRDEGRLVRLVQNANEDSNEVIPAPLRKRPPGSSLSPMQASKRWLQLATLEKNPSVSAATDRKEVICKNPESAFSVSRLPQCIIDSIPDFCGMSLAFKYCTIPVTVTTNVDGSETL